MWESSVTATSDHFSFKHVLLQQFTGMCLWGKVIVFVNSIECEIFGEGCFLASDWLKYETLPRKFRTLLLVLLLILVIDFMIPTVFNCNIL